MKMNSLFTVDKDTCSCLFSFTYSCHMVEVGVKEQVAIIGSKSHRLMEKLIRGQDSHLHLLTHFHPSHHLHLHLSFTFPRLLMSVF